MNLQRHAVTQRPTAAITGLTRFCAVVADPIHHVRTPQGVNSLLAEAGIDAVLVPIRSGTGDSGQNRSNAVVTRLLIADGRCSDVEFVADDQSVVQVHADREVLLCAGSVQSPQLLELSGVGRPGAPADAWHPAAACVARCR